jgi:hypothetical protein
MNTLNFVTELWGIFMVVASLSLLVNQGLIKKIFTFADDELTIFFGGILTFIIGVASVLSYNVWVYNWTVAITIFGWVAILKGICLLFFPSWSRKMHNMLKDKEWIPYLLLVAIFIGCFLVYAGFVLK